VIGYGIFVIQPPMNERRMGLITRAFLKMDRTGDGKITIDDLRGESGKAVHLSA